MTSLRRAIRPGTPPIRVLWCVLLVVVAHLGLTLPALSAQDSTDAPDPAVELAAEASVLWIEIDTLYEKFTQAEGEERLVLDGQLDRRVAVLRPLLGELTEKIVEMDSAGLDASAPRAVATKMLDRARGLVREELTAIGVRVLELREERSTASPSELVTIERRLTQQSTEYDGHLRSLINIAGSKAALGLDVQADHDYVDPLLIARADRVTSEAGVALEAVSDLSQRLEDAGDENEAQSIQVELTAAEERLHAATSGLGTVVELLDRREIEASEYKQTLIRTTGRVTTDVLDVDVATGLVRQAWNSATGWLFEHAPRMLFNLFMFLVIVLPSMWRLRFMPVPYCEARARVAGAYRRVGFRPNAGFRPIEGRPPTQPQPPGLFPRGDTVSGWSPRPSTGLVVHDLGG